ncbi:MAG: TlyA family RNA methyltransferase [Candidatus Binataceae bacterium]|nr:TlyA family RNA methyltransferase [Candidatus Binataceae bacterium]
MTRRGVAESRERAQRLIMAGRVRVDSRTAYKADLRVSAEAEIVLVGGPREYASRGAYKLSAALDAFAIEVDGRDAVDIGASNGGFTDVLLRRGVARVIAIDVGYGQLASNLRGDTRVSVMDRTNIRFVKSKDLPYRPDLAVIDVSFISLRLVIPVLVEISAPSAEIIALIKPQFEVGRGLTGKGGVVRDEELRARTVAEIVEFATKLNLVCGGTISSPITGAAGNQEYLAWFRKSQNLATE